MIRLDHAAIAVPDVEAAARRFVDLGLPVGEVSEFETEDTREIYVEIAPVRVLLLQPRGKSGPIGRHVARRGWGWHHLGFQVDDLRRILSSLRHWCVCPSTFRNLESGGPAWLVRPEERLLFELQPGEGRPPGGPAVFRQAVIDLPALPLGQKLFTAIGIEADVPILLRRGEGGLCRIDLEVAGKRVELPSSI